MWNVLHVLNIIIIIILRDNWFQICEKSFTYIEIYVSSKTIIYFWKSKNKAQQLLTFHRINGFGIPLGTLV